MVEWLFMYHNYPARQCLQSTRLTIFFYTMCFCKYDSFSLKIVWNQPPIVIPMTSYPQPSNHLEIPFFPAAIQASSFLGSLFNSALVCFSLNFCTSSDLPGLLYLAGLSHLPFLSGEPFLYYCHNF